jgi:HEAT repeat protein
LKRNFSKEEIEELILDLGSDDQEVIDFAMSALLMANPRRHLSDMIEALQWGDDIIKQRICYIFGGIIDERCVDPLLSTLNDENIDTRLAAIDSLQYFPNERIIPHLKDQLKHDDEDVHEATILTLGAFVKHGVINAHVPLVEIVQNEDETIELRRTALMNLKHLDEEELMPILDRLKDLSDASIYSHILLLQDDLGKNKEQKIAQTEQIIQRLFTEKDALKQIRLEDLLAEGGSLTAKVLIKKIFEQPDNAMLRVHARMIFEKMGYKSIAAFKWLLETFDRFNDLMQVVLLQDLITLVAQRKYIALARPMVKLLNRINAYIEQQNSETIQKEFDHIKSDIHFALATYGCREAVEDMKAIMRDGTQRQFLELIEALVHVGDRDFLIPLINQYQAYRDFKRPSKTVKRAFKAIVRREKIRRNDPMFNNLTELQKQNLSLIMKR